MTSIFFRYLFSQFIFLFGIIWAVVGTPLLAVGIATWLSETRLSREGVRAEATLVEKIHTTGKNQSSSYRLKYVFRDRDGYERIREAQVGWETWRSFEDGQKLPILYLPDKPDKNRLGAPFKESDWWILPLVFGLLGSIFGGVGWVLVILALRRALRALDLLRTGVILSGTVSDLREDLSTRINGRHPLILHFRFRGPDGLEHEGQTFHLPRKLETRWKPGDPIPVVCDPTDSSRHEADLYGVRVGAGSEPGAGMGPGLTG